MCGMMYCQGQESDEKLHAAYHSSHLQGIRFQARYSCFEEIVETSPLLDSREMS